MIARSKFSLPQKLTAVNRPAVFRAALFILACLPIYQALRIQTRLWVDIPIWDEWDTPGNTLLHLAQHKLTWTELFSQHNESRKFFPRLVYILMSTPMGWDVRQGMVLTSMAACALSGFLLTHLRDAGKLFSGPALLIWFLINALLFGPSQSENFLCGYSFEFLIPVLALCGCIALNLSDRSLAAKVVWNSLLSLIATYSFAHGMLLWVLALPIPAARDQERAGWRRRWTMWALVYGVVGIVAIGSYFIGYQRPDVAPPPATITQAPLVAHYLIVWLGALLQSNSIDPVVAGGIAASVLLLACALSLFLISQNRSLGRRYYPWLLLAAFAAGAGILSAIGRANLGIASLLYVGVEGFSGYRYYLNSVLAYIAAVGLLYRLYRDWFAADPVWRPRFAIATTVLITLLGVAWLYLFASHRDRLNAFQDNRRRARTAVIWSRAVPLNPELFHAYPYPEDFPRRIAELQKAGVIRLPEISDYISHAVSLSPQGGPAAPGAIQDCTVDPGKTMRIWGWATVPGENARADYVVTGWEKGLGSFNPFTVTPTGRRRPEVTDAAAPAWLRNAGFLQEVDISKLPQDPITIRAWGVDLGRQHVFPIEGTVQLDRGTKVPVSDGP